jgi:hypothetical protein
MSVFCGSTSKFSAALLKGIEGGTRDTMSYTSSGLSPTSNLGDLQIRIPRFKCSEGLQRGFVS